MKEELKIAVIQTEIFWEDRTSNLQHFKKKISDLDSSLDIIVLPETFTTGFTMNKEAADDGESTINWMKEVAAQKGVAIAGSIFVLSEGNLFNRLYFVTASGNVSYYNKRHLFRLTSENEIFTKGTEHAVVEFEGWKISLQVCYDLRFPVWLRRTESNNYDLLLLVANWPDRRAYAWNKLLMARAIENQAYVVGANRVGPDGTGILHAGDSVILDAMGKVVSKAPMFKEATIEASLSYRELNKIRTQLPFGMDADRFMIE